MSRKITSKTAIKKAQSTDCSTFMKTFDEQIEWDEIENIGNFNEGMVNIAFHGTDETRYLLFIDGEFDTASY
jgi:hypothetical protein